MISVFKDLEQLNVAAAELFVQAAIGAVSARGRFTVALTGGSSPVGLYKLLATAPYRDQVPWEQVYVFWGDERWVPFDSELSNTRMAFDSLLDHVPIPASQIFPMWADGISPEEFARGYEQLLRLHLQPSGRFDLILLGMGADGHTASWFPHTGVLKEDSKWVAAYYLHAQDMHRITLTVPLVNQASQIAVIAYGSNKADAFYEVTSGARNTDQYPAQLLDRAGERVSWMVDEQTAAKL